MSKNFSNNSCEFLKLYKYLSIPNDFAYHLKFGRNARIQKMGLHFYAFKTSIAFLQARIIYWNSYDNICCAVKLMFLSVMVQIFTPVTAVVNSLKQKVIIKEKPEKTLILV